ncbi:hypothetical protein QFE97_14700 [Bacillus subtilis]|nr:hypothetical protein QFE97_14700 [Bacillus subtilis]
MAIAAKAAARATMATTADALRRGDVCLSAVERCFGDPAGVVVGAGADAGADSWLLGWAIVVASVFEASVISDDFDATEDGNAAVESAIPNTQ